MAAPRCEINLSKIQHNAGELKRLFRSKGISVTAVTKGVAGSPAVAKALVESGIRSLGDSHVANIRKMKDAGIEAEFLLTRTPMLSEAEAVVADVDISLNSELEVIKTLNRYAGQTHKRHRIVLMIEMGDLREGILAKDVEKTVEEVLKLQGIEIAGIGTNMACFAGVKPTESNMKELSDIADRIRQKFDIQLDLISAGNSGNYEWFMEMDDPGSINHLRIGEAILLGCETLQREKIPGCYTDAFTLVAEVIERKTKPSVPDGARCQNSFGEQAEFSDKGLMKRAILGIGKQDVELSGIYPRISVDIVGGSSDHIILDVKNTDIQVGTEVTFDLSYSALLRIMTSYYVEKVFIDKVG